MLSDLQEDRDFWRSSLASYALSTQSALDRDSQIQQALNQVRPFAGTFTGRQVEGSMSAISRSNAGLLKDVIDRSLTFIREQNVLESLRFTTMDTREAIISKAHSQTFKWILYPHAPATGTSPLTRIPSAAYKQEVDEGSSAELDLRGWESGLRTDFVDWLQSSDEIYWIAGKPGSGKSTLMKYILGDPKTQQNLKVWAKGYRLYIARYFFWYRGTEMQRSQQGLLQGLLHTVLEAAMDSPLRSVRLEWQKLTLPGLWTS